MGGECCTDGGWMVSDTNSLIRKTYWAPQLPPTITMSNDSPIICIHNTVLLSHQSGYHCLFISHTHTHTHTLYRQLWNIIEVCVFVIQSNWSSTGSSWVFEQQVIKLRIWIDWTGESVISDYSKETLRTDSRGVCYHFTFLGNISPGEMDQKDSHLSLEFVQLLGHVSIGWCKIYM